MLTMETDVTLGGRTVTYQRRVSVGADGTCRVTVPYAGAYTVGNETVQVSEQAVMAVRNVTV